MSAVRGVIATGKRRGPQLGRRALAGVVVVMASLILTTGCLVTRTPPSSTAGAGDQKLLKRANEELLEQIQLEQEHVESYNRKLIQLRAKERRLSAEFRKGESDYQLLASDREGQLQEAFEAQQEYQKALDRKVQMESQLVAVRAEAQALEQERAVLEAAIADNRAATTRGQARLARTEQRLQEVTAQAARQAEELATRRRLLESRRGQAAALWEELALLSAHLKELEGGTQWLRSSFLAAIFSATLRRELSESTGALAEDPGVGNDPGSPPGSSPIPGSEPGVAPADAPEAGAGPAGGPESAPEGPA